MPSKFYAGGGKRALDVTLSILGLVIFSPIILIAALAILLESGWPVVFTQKRCGRAGMLFNLYKLRSMSKSPRVSETEFEAGSALRVTRVGRVLRKTKLDETLQLFNVIKGDMSIIGPRPEVPYWVAQYPEQWKIAHKVRPGLSDEASLKFRNEEEELASVSDPEAHYRDVILPNKLALYSNYVTCYGLQYDAILIFRTVKAVIF